MKTLAEVFFDYAQTQPDALFAADGSGAFLTYAQALARARHVAARLRDGFGVRRGDRVVVRCAQSVGYLTVYLACNLLGAVIVPIEDRASGERIQSIAGETECALCVSGIAEKTVEPTVSYRELEAGDGVLEAIEFPEPESVSEILYTTGTTGKSKGIVMTHRANVALAENVRYGVAMKPGSVELIPLVMSHSHGLRTFYGNLLNGGAVVLTNGVMNIKGLFALMERFGVTALDLSPSAAQFLIQLGQASFWEKARKLDYIQIGTAALPEALKKTLADNLPGVRLYNFYGSTESGRTCVLDFNAERDREKCIGRPAKNAEIIFTDDDRHPVDATPEHPGLLASRGPMNMERYWKNEALTGGILVNGFVCTNDMGYFDAQGFAYVVGRRDDVINYAGIKISPGEVEDVVLQYPGIAETAFVGRKDPAVGELPVLFVAPSDGGFDLEAFNAFLRARVDRSKLPKAVEVVEALPRTFNGKIDRKKMAEPVKP